MVLGSPDLLLGKPIVADPFMPAVATGAHCVSFGDMSTFVVRLVGTTKRFLSAATSLAKVPAQFRRRREVQENYVHSSCPLSKFLQSHSSCPRS